MKKLLLAALLALLCVSLAGCARPGTDPASTQDQRLILVGFPRWAPKATGGRPTR